MIREHEPNVLVVRQIIDVLSAHGVTHYFGVPGGQCLALMDAVSRDPNLTFVTVRHENSAACAADGYFRATGTMAAAVVTAGPGLTNAITGLGGAFRDGSAVFLISGDNARGLLERDTLQEANLTALTRPVVKGSRFVTVPERAAEATSELCRLALRGAPGPVHMNVPQDVLEGTTDGTRRRAADQLYFPPAPSPEAISLLVRELVERPRICLWLGAGVLRADAVAAWAAVRSQLDVPTITTYNGIGAATWPARAVFGPRSGKRTRLSSKVLAEAETCLAVGNKLGGPATANGSAQLPGRLIQVDISPEALGRHYDLYAGICGDARLTAEMILRELGATELPPSVREERREWVDSLHAFEVEWARELEVAWTQETLGPRDLVQVVEHQLSSSPAALLVSGAGNTGIWSHLIRSGRDTFFQKPVGFGNMGYELPAALGAAIGTGRPVIVAVGDGSATMSIMELATISQLSLPITVILWNDSSYGNIAEYQEFRGWSETVSLNDITGTDYVALAKSMGLHATTAATREELEAQLSLSVASGRPSLINAPVLLKPSVWTFPF